MPARRELHLSEGVAVQGDEDAGVTRTPRGQPCRRRRSGWHSGSGPCGMKWLPVDRRADCPHRVLNVGLLWFMALGGLVPAREDPTPPSELLIDQERSALTGNAGLSGRARIRGPLPRPRPPARAEPPRPPQVEPRGPAPPHSSTPHRNPASGAARPPPPPRRRSRQGGAEGPGVHRAGMQEVAESSQPAPPNPRAPLPAAFTIYINRFT